jgi:hypothetical protein
MAYRTMGGATDPMAATVAPVFGMPAFSPQDTGSAQVAPLYVHPLVAQAWPVQALLESLRRQYLGV